MQDELAKLNTALGGSSYQVLDDGAEHGSMLVKRGEKGGVWKVEVTRLGRDYREAEGKL